ncbi:MAG: Bug family tripartite tricarboxylate transporter substrate binding protein [Pigmentiphaga sp.]
MKRTPSLIATALFGLSSALASPAFAQSSETIRLVVGFPPGGVVDVVARTFAEHARQATDHTLVVENRPGASGKLAMDTLLNGPSDGLTLLIAPASMVELTPMVIPSANYDPVNDLVAMGGLAEYGFGVAAGPSSGTKTIDEYRDWADANPELSNFATPGQGTPQHFLGAQLQDLLGVELMHVPYRGGAAAINDVLGGQVPLFITSEQLLIPYEGQGKLHTLFITSPKRNPLMPNVPTSQEVGLPQLETADWFGAFLKAGTPSAQEEVLRSQVQQVLASPAYIEAINKLGYAVPEKQPDDFVELMRSEIQAWEQRLKLSGFDPNE